MEQQQTVIRSVWRTRHKFARAEARFTVQVALGRRQRSTGRIRHRLRASRRPAAALTGARRKRVMFHLLSIYDACSCSKINVIAVWSGHEKPGEARGAAW